MSLNTRVNVGQVIDPFRPLQQSLTQVGNLYSDYVDSQRKREEAEYNRQRQEAADARAQDLYNRQTAEYDRRAMLQGQEDKRTKGLEEYFSRYPEQGIRQASAFALANDPSTLRELNRSVVAAGEELGQRYDLGSEGLRGLLTRDDVAEQDKELIRGMTETYSAAPVWREDEAVRISRDLLSRGLVAPTEIEKARVLGESLATGSSLKEAQERSAERAKQLNEAAKIRREDIKEDVRAIEKEWDAGLKRFNALGGKADADQVLNAATPFLELDKLDIGVFDSAAARKNINALLDAGVPPKDIVNAMYSTFRQGSGVFGLFSDRTIGNLDELKTAVEQNNVRGITVPEYPSDRINALRMEGRIPLVTPDSTGAIREQGSQALLNRMNLLRTPSSSAPQTQARIDRPASSGVVAEQPAVDSTNRGLTQEEFDRLNSVLTNEAIDQNQQDRISRFFNAIGQEDQREQQYVILGEGDREVGRVVAGDLPIESLNEIGQERARQILLEQFRKENPTWLERAGRGALDRANILGQSQIDLGRNVVGVNNRLMEYLTRRPEPGESVGERLVRRLNDEAVSQPDRSALDATTRGIRPETLEQLRRTREEMGPPERSFSEPTESRGSLGRALDFLIPPASAFSRRPRDLPTQNVEPGLTIEISGGRPENDSTLSESIRDNNLTPKKLESIGVDYEFIKRQEESSDSRQSQIGFVPSRDGNVIGNSGVTVGTGIDLGKQGERELRSLGVNQQLIDKVKPYLGVTGKAAVDLVTSKPLSLTRNEVDILNNAYLTRDVSSIIGSIGEERYMSLEPEAKTVILSLVRNFGPKAMNYNTVRDLVAGRYESARLRLENPEKYGFTNRELDARRQREAALIKQIEERLN